MEQRPKILIVDDEPLNIDYLEQELEDLGYETVTAGNGVDGLRQVAEASPDMVLLDIMMPIMDGFEMLRQLKAEPAWRTIPVVVISALSDMDNVVKGIHLGADDYLPKPFNPTLLEARLKAGLIRKRLHDLEKLYTQSLERELEIGHQIQADFLPDSLPEVNGWQIAAHFQAAREVAGDFYDVFNLTDGLLGFFLGDVTDKGVGSALFMSLYRSLLRAFISDGRSWIDSGKTDDRSEVLHRAVFQTNQYVCQTHANPLFATLFIGILDPYTGEFQYINAGHNSPQILRKDGTRNELRPTGSTIGVMADIDFNVGQASLEPGDALVIYSDGMEDTTNPAGEFFGRQRLLELILPSVSAANLVERLTTSLLNFMGEAKRFDDVTLLVLMREAKGESVHG
jgi:sigma-B regulation protein RsbU (phosphoserine phosphatase)